ncbi:MAG: pseudouridine synthase [Cytophagales bacterium]|nr:pseudouridine synthase [Cytophagales bacterium]
MPDRVFLEIIYQDDYLVAINKPHDLLVHRTKIAAEADVFALQLLRNQIDKHVYPIHRLDRKTGGVLLFGLNEEIHRTMQKQFAARNVSKKYLAIVRGFTDDEQVIDYPVRKDNGVLQDAVTRFRTVDKVELDIPFGKHATSRYSLLDVFPETGRKHQIRKHLAHINHPIIADRPHGCNKQNKLFKDRFDLMTMLLHAGELAFSHPVSNKKIRIKARLHLEFQRITNELGFAYTS